LRLKGQSLVQIADANGVGPQELIDTILAAKKAKIAADSRLTPEQAELMIQNMTSRI